MTPPLPFREALQHLLSKQVMPTSMGSAEIAALDASVRRQSFFSARTLLEDLIQQYKADVESIINPQRVQRADRVTPDNPEGWVTEGLDPATARLRAQQLLDSLGYDPGEDRGTIKDLRSRARIDLVVKTNTELAQGAGHFVKQNDPELVDAFPALELTRYEQRHEPRDWQQRWILAAQVAGDPQAYGALGNHGRLVALKSSGIWQALGDGAGGYTDTLGNPYPPFAFGSGMWTQEVDREDAEALGLLQRLEVAAPAQFDFGSLFKHAA